MCRVSRGRNYQKHRCLIEETWYGGVVGSVKPLAKRLVSSQPDWDLVFNFCEGYGTLGREAQVPALLEAWDIPFTFSDSATLALCMDKAKTKVSKQRSAG